MGLVYCVAFASIRERKLALQRTWQERSSRANRLAGLPITGQHADYRRA